MDVVLFLDTDRNLELIGKWDCTVERRNGLLEWKGRWSYKFVVTTDDTLVIGTIRNHVQVLGLFFCRDHATEEAQEQIAKMVQSPRDHSHLISAAGTIDANGQVVEWESGGFRIVTPLDRRQELQAVIIELYEAERLKPY